MFVAALMSVLPLGLGSSDALETTATILADTLEVGQEYELLVEVRSPEGSSISEAGLPAPILQIQVPPSAQLVGAVLESHQQLSKNEFLKAPFERLLKDNPARVKFKLLKKPSDNEGFFLPVLAYVKFGGEQNSRFVRQRLMVPLAANAEGRSVPASPSDWGREASLQLGECAAAFALPAAAGNSVELAAYLGKKNVVVTTYRAFW